MGRLTSLFSVNCCFLTIVIVIVACLVPLLWPSPNQGIIDAVRSRSYKQLHRLVERQVERITGERRAQPEKWAGRTNAVVDDIDFGSGRRAMHIAAMHGDLPTLRYFHKRGASIHVAKDHDGRTPLHIAATFNTVDVVKQLIQWGSLVDAPAASGWTPLLKAVLLSNHDIVEALLLAGADPNAAVDGSFNALQCAIIYSDERMIFLLIKAGAYIEEGEQRYDVYAEHLENILRAGHLKEEDIPLKGMRAQPSMEDDEEADDSEQHPSTRSKQPTDAASDDGEIDAEFAADAYKAG